jgi:hypothetical protein
MRPIALNTALAVLLCPLAPALHAAGELKLDSAIYVFKQGDFHEIDIPGATAAGNGSLIFKSPATARFDHLTLSLEGPRVGWGMGRATPEQFSLVAAPASVPIVLGAPLSMTSSTAVQFLEPVSGGNFHINEIPAESSEAPHIRLTFTAKTAEETSGDFLLNCDLDIATVSSRRNIPGVALEVGRPLITPFKVNLDVPMSLESWTGVLLKAPNGSDYSMLILLQLASGKPAKTADSAEANSISASSAPESAWDAKPASDPIAEDDKAPRGFTWPSNRGLDSVAVAAGADEKYSQERFNVRDAKPKGESYVLAKGTYFAGFVRDASLENTQFADIARTLKRDLAVNQYYPSADSKNADLLIVVHWGATYGGLGGSTVGGATARRRLWSNSDGYLWDGPNPDWFAVIDSQLLGFDYMRQQDYYRKLGLSLLRAPDTYNKSFDGAYRYFVILEAYDFHSVKAGKTGPKPKLLWSVHYSLPAIGNNFTEALPEMSNVAAKFFGRNVGGVLFKAQKIPEGVVKIGDPKEIEDAQWK